ncbi:hypothetical protein SARC_07760 [Sphaeroforma arctica JP610]|uniref:Uncharacterized protein n=1 Tax=Sphaeroforma arctica JP610 TaxID=667725 RepID=A0A0L0FT44_9EUKA|nr:hypothetical protein SARC_07760 [Sphaeroforma arctica JP610]KNC79864.1 hypothetical protein SARC_07760 [Sphaeroforma arctica JP610]|eukprot:XP_014153766.1 hypothetical protein SARC_07760 [Sphaeroforma arctica JP610]
MCSASLLQFICFMSEMVYTACGFSLFVHSNNLVCVGETFEKYTGYFSEYDRTPRYRRGKILTEADRRGILADIEEIRQELFPTGNAYGDVACRTWESPKGSYCEGSQSGEAKISLSKQVSLLKAEEEKNDEAVRRHSAEVESSKWAQRFITKLKYNYQPDRNKRRSSLFAPTTTLNDNTMHYVEATLYHANADPTSPDAIHLHTSLNSTTSDINDAFSGLDLVEDDKVRSNLRRLESETMPNRRTSESSADSATTRTNRVLIGITEAETQEYSGVLRRDSITKQVNLPEDLVTEEKTIPDN